MSAKQQEGTTNETNDAVTPSTSSRVKPAPVENAFPTPPRREGAHASDSPIANRFFGTGKSPREHKSLEALRAFSRSGYNSGRSSATEFERPPRKEISQRKSQLFDQAFAVRDSYYSAKERVGRDALVVVELKMNQGLEHEKSFLNDFQLLLSETYYKPSQNIMISVDTEHHIMMGTSQDPAYLMTVAALAPEIASMKNLRTTKLVQAFLFESLQIPANRGVIIFNTVKEEDFSMNGCTLEDEIARLEVDDKRGMSTRSRQSTRNKRGSTLTGSDQPTHAEHTKLHSSDDFDSEKELYQHGMEGLNFEKFTRSSSNAKRLAGKKSFIMSLWKKN